MRRTIKGGNEGMRDRQCNAGMGLCLAFMLFVAALYPERMISAQAVEQEGGERQATPGKWTPGYYLKPELAILAGHTNRTVGAFLSGGLRLSPEFSAGIGAGYLPYNDPLGLVPLYLEGDYRIGRGKLSHFLFLRSGYGISVNSGNGGDLESHRGGLLLNPGYRLAVDTGLGFSLNILAGLHLDNASFEGRRWDGRTVRTDIEYRRFQFGMGVQF